MILLDTDHLSVLTDQRQTLRQPLLDRLLTANDIVGVPIVSVEEQLRGWLAQIRRVTEVHRQIVPYKRLAKTFDFFRDWNIVDWNEPAADAFTRLRRQRIRVGTQDLKIASIAMANNAILLGQLARFRAGAGIARGRLALRLTCSCTFDFHHHHAMHLQPRHGQRHHIAVAA
jgi:tRNA(fMet)-specific endonuclease VapC